MKIDASRVGGTAVLRLGGRLDREAAEQLSNSLEDLVRFGARSLTVDLAAVTYISSAAVKVLARWQQELTTLRGSVQVTSPPAALQQTLAIAGWDALAGRNGSGSGELRLSSWQHHPGTASSGEYQVSARPGEGALVCRLHGRPGPLSEAPVGESDCAVVTFPGDSFGLGIGAIGSSYDACRDRFGELIAVAGCVAYFPSDGARMADYLVADGPTPPSTILTAGLSCHGEFSKLVRFSALPEAESIPLSELAAVCLEASGGRTAGLVIAGETAGLAGVRLRRSPAASGDSTLQFELPAVREWLSFASERTHPVTTSLIAGVVARGPKGPLASYLRPIGMVGQLWAHFHAAVFSYQPLPQRTVELGDLLRGLFINHQLRDVVHLVWDDRGGASVGESALVRGVVWVGPITEIS
ncbi:MAG TPA: STAS domain-containing protein [Gemmatimonadales bacterium]|nr:STAS domain-containing protein [Gemmatimonadales bacterium]